jgi:guanosine-3',5'-bis(diphosphate) 3'-pyrophosphohydrolase
MDLEDKFSIRFLAALEKMDRSKPFDFNCIKKAMLIAKKAHNNQQRDCSSPYYSHPIEVSEILISGLKENVTTEMIAVSIMHDVVEDSDNITIDNLRSMFGVEISSMVDLVTRIKENGIELSMKNIMDILLESGDKKAQYIKLCDRIHNLATMMNRPRENIVKKILETLDCKFLFIAAENGIDFEKILSKLLSMNIDYNLINRVNLNTNSYKLPR